MLEVADSALTAGHIATEDPYALDPGLPATKGLSELRTRGFDCAVLEGSPAERFVTTAALERCEPSAVVREVAKPITTRELIHGGAPLTHAIQRLKERRVLFVLMPGGELGICTVADLGRPAVGMIVLALILAAEAGLVTLLSESPGAQLEAEMARCLSEATCEEARGRHREKRRRNADLSLAASLTFEMRLELVRCSDDRRARLGYTSKSSVEREKKSLSRTRNELAHAGDLLSLTNGDPVQAIEEVDRVRDFADRVLRALNGGP